MAITYDEKKRLYGIKGKVKMPNGKYKNYNRKPQWSRKKDAVQEEHDLRVYLSRLNEDVTFNQVVNLYMKNTRGLKESTLDNTYSVYTHHIKPVFGNVLIKNVTVVQIESWMADLIDKKQYKEGTINSILKIFKKFMNYAQRMEYIDKNPARKIEPYRDNTTLKDDDIENFWTVNEFKRFIACVDKPDMNLMYRFLFMTGVRKGEMRALQWKDIDFDKETCRIYKTVYEANKITTPKTPRSNRTILLDTDTIIRLERRYESQKRIDGFTDDWYVFGSYKPIQEDKIRYTMKKYIKLSKVKNITVHGLRHSHASMLIRMKIDDSVIAERLGHSIMVLRNTYAHIYDESKDELKDKLDTIL